MEHLWYSWYDIVNGEVAQMSAMTYEALVQELKTMFAVDRLSEIDPRTVGVNGYFIRKGSHGRVKVYYADTRPGGSAMTSGFVLTYKARIMQMVGASRVRSGAARVRAGGKLRMVPTIEIELS